MGNKLATQAATPDANLADVGAGALQLEQRLGDGRFLKTLKCLNADGALVVKVFSKRDLNLSLAHYQELLHEVRYYVVWVLPGQPGWRGGIIYGVHPHAWEFVQGLLPGGQYAGSGARLQRARDLAGALERYRAEAPRYACVLPPALVAVPALRGWRTSRLPPL